MFNVCVNMFESGWVVDQTKVCRFVVKKVNPSIVLDVPVVNARDGGSIVVMELEVSIYFPDQAN